MSVAMPLHLSVGGGGLDVQQGGVELLEGLEPPLVAGPGQMRGEPLSDLESGPSVWLVVELDSESRFERLNVVLQSAGDVHDAFEQVAIGDVGEVNVNVDAEIGLGSGDLRPPLEAARSHVELDLVSWERVATRAPPRREVIRIGEGPECQLSGCVENARDGELWLVWGHQSSSLSSRSAAWTAARWTSRRSRDMFQKLLKRSIQSAASRSGAVSRWLARHLPDRLREMRAACSSTFRCRETAGSDIGSGALSSVTVASRSASSSRIARRVGSESAENTALSWSVPAITSRHLTNSLSVCEGRS